MSSVLCPYTLYSRLSIDRSTVSATVLFAVTLVVTSYRCFARFSRKIWGHDDSVALFSSLIFVFFVIGSSNDRLGWRAPNDNFSSVVLGTSILTRGKALLMAYL